jgi:hypothetical protein
LALGATISGFAVDDILAFDNAKITSAQFAATGANGGDLNLHEGTKLVGALALSGSYADDTFTVTPTSNGADVIIGPALKIVAPSALSLTAGESSAASGFKISDVTASSGDIFTVQVSTQNGLLTANTTAAGGGGTIAGAGTFDLTIAGTLAQVNADLGTLSDTERSLEADAISVSASNGGSATAAAKTTASSSGGLTIVPNFLGGGINRSHYFRQRAAQRRRRQLWRQRRQQAHYRGDACQQ